MFVWGLVRGGEKKIKLLRSRREGERDTWSHCLLSGTLQRSEAVGLVVIDEEDNQTLLVHRISADDIYRRQEGGCSVFIISSRDSEMDAVSFTLQWWWYYLPFLLRPNGLIFCAISKTKYLNCCCIQSSILLTNTMAVLAHGLVADTIISWTDPEVATDLALSFQETMGCSFIWLAFHYVHMLWWEDTGSWI